MSTTTKILFQVTARVPKESLEAARRKKIPLQEFSVSHEENGKLVYGSLFIDIGNVEQGEYNDVMNFKGAIMQVRGAELALRFRNINLLGLSCAGHVSSKAADGQIKAVATG